MEVPSDAANVAVVVDVTVSVDTVNVVLVAPAAMRTVEGTVADAVLEVRFTVAPPEGATPLSVRNPVELVPPVTVDGETMNELSVAGLMISVDDFESVPIEPVIRA